MKNQVPWWLFAVIAAGTLLASGIFLGIMSIEGPTARRIVEAIGFGLLGLVMLWGATHSRVGPAENSGSAASGASTKKRTP